MSHHLARARRIDNGELVEGYYSPEFLIETHETGDFYPTTKTILNVISKDAETAYEINPDTLQRCTGLKDKNGNWIFEGQYFFDEKLLCEIRWSPIKCCFYVFSETMPILPMDLFKWSKIEVFNDDGSWERV